VRLVLFEGKQLPKTRSKLPTVELIEGDIVKNTKRRAKRKDTKVYISKEAVFDVVDHYPKGITVLKLSEILESGTSVLYARINELIKENRVVFFAQRVYSREFKKNYIPEINKYKVARKKLKITQRELSLLCGVNYSTISRLECGYQLKESTIKRVEESLNNEPQ